MESDKHVPITGLPDMVRGAKPDRKLFVLIYYTHETRTSYVLSQIRMTTQVATNRNSQSGFISVLTQS